MDVFPIPQEFNYDYADRFSLEPGGHKGTDIFADKTTPVVAVADGLAFATTDPRGGTVIYLMDASGFGTKYYYAHLDSVVDPLDPDVRFPVPPDALVEVNAGDVIGFVGDSGNAKGKAPHLHFQVSEGIPGTDPPKFQVVNPFPLLASIDPEAPDRVFREGMGAGLGTAALVLLAIWLIGKHNG